MENILQIKNLHTYYLTDHSELPVVNGISLIIERGKVLALVGESALSLLGLGIMEPYASWGNMLTRAMSITEIQLHPWILWPGVFIFITVMAFNFLGDGLRDILDPRAIITGRVRKLYVRGPASHI